MMKLTNIFCIIKIKTQKNIKKYEKILIYLIYYLVELFLSILSQVVFLIIYLYNLLILK